MSNNDEASITSPKTLFQLDNSFVGYNTFQYKPAPTANDSDRKYIKTSVYCIRLNRLIKSENKLAKDVIKQKFKLKRTRDLIHTLCALYDNSLPDMGPQSIYDCICSPKSFTICVLKNEEDINIENKEDSNDLGSVYGSQDDLKNIENSYTYPESVFHNLFSDDEESDDDDDDDNDDDIPKKIDFTHGIKSYLNECRNDDEKNEKNVPLLKNIIGAATIQKTSTYQLPGQDEWVVDLELMSVRPNYRGLNIGKYLINLIQNKNYVGNFDAIVTSSDIDAVKFYEKYGFNIDPILNSKYKFIGDIWTNTTKMCYIPPYCQSSDKNQGKLREAFSLFSQKPMIKPIENMDNKDDIEEIEDKNDNFDNSCITELTYMESDFKRWQKLMFSAYQSQAQLFYKMKEEVTNMKIKLSAKESIIGDLKFQNDMLLKKNNLLKMKMGKTLDDEAFNTDSDCPILNNIEENSETDLDKLIADLKILSKKKNY